MGKIKRLLEHEAQKIAAGEVVERPANVIKELIENAIDAGSTTLNLYVENAGKKLIRIVDNGCGMSLEDARLCIEHHATSKINSVDDLHTIQTFGFRGEALASISAVSQVTIVTKESSSHEGIKLEIEKNNILKETIVSCPIGTDIRVNNLFYNIPARKKFLRSNETELRQINNLLQAFCFDHPQIHFKFFSENKLVYNCPATALIATRIAQIWPTMDAQHMLSIDVPYEKYGVRISGTISDHQYSRYDRNQIYFFVNRRWVKNYTLARSLIKGYAHVLPQGKFPAAIIFIDVKPDTVDINIHPRKEEVQFLHPGNVQQCIEKTVKQALEKNLSHHIKKPVIFKNNPDYAPATWHEPPPVIIPDFKYGTHRYDDSVPEPFSAPIPTQMQSEQKNFAQDVKQQSFELSHEKQQTTTEQYADQLIGQYAKTYILLNKPNGLFIVDQHAAHERILYELFSQRFERVATISLLFPYMIQLIAQDMAVIEPYLYIFSQNGIAIERFGDNQLIVTATPVHLKDRSVEDLIKLSIGWITQDQRTNNDQLAQTIHQKMRAQMACKAAVKAGDQLDGQQMEQLLADLAKCPNNLTCPHGRPTGWLLGTHEIEKRFKRRI